MVLPWSDLEIKDMLNIKPWDFLSNCDKFVKIILFSFSIKEHGKLTPVPQYLLVHLKMFLKTQKQPFRGSQRILRTLAITVKPHCNPVRAWIQWSEGQVDHYKATQLGCVTGLSTDLIMLVCHLFAGKRWLASHLRAVFIYMRLWRYLQDHEIKMEKLDSIPWWECLPELGRS